MTVIEDADSGNAWFLETEGSHNWNIKFTTYGGYTAGNFTVEASGCDEKEIVYIFVLCSIVNDVRLKK